MAATTEMVTEVELLLYKCSECSQLFQMPADFLEHQATHFPAPVPEAAEPATQQETQVPSPTEAAVSQPEPLPASDHSYELRNELRNGEAIGRDRRGRKPRRNNSGESGGRPPRNYFALPVTSSFSHPTSYSSTFGVTGRVFLSVPCAVVSSLALLVWTSTLVTIAVSLTSCV